MSARRGYNQLAMEAVKGGWGKGAGDRSTLKMGQTAVWGVRWGWAAMEAEAPYGLTWRQDGAWTSSGGFLLSHTLPWVWEKNIIAYYLSLESLRERAVYLRKISTEQLGCDKIECRASVARWVGISESALSKKWTEIFGSRNEKAVEER